MSADTASGPTQDQLEILEYNFSKVNKHPDPTTLLLIAAEAGLSEEETQVRPPRPGRVPSPGLRAPHADIRAPLALAWPPSPILHLRCTHSGSPFPGARFCIAPTAAPHSPGSLAPHPLPRNPSPRGRASPGAA